MEDSNKKTYVYKNNVSPSKRKNVSESINYNKISYKDRK